MSKIQLSITANQFKAILREELKGFATKDDLKDFARKDDLKGFATKDDLKDFAKKDDLKGFATKDDLKDFARKEDLEVFATKDDLQRETKLIWQQLVRLATRDEVQQMFDRVMEDMVSLNDQHLRKYHLDKKQSVCNQSSAS